MRTNYETEGLTVLCNSWIVVDKVTGKAVLETYQRSVADKVNTARYEVLTAYEYLVRLNRDIKAGRRYMYAD